LIGQSAILTQGFTIMKSGFVCELTRESYTQDLCSNNSPFNQCSWKSRALVCLWLNVLVVTLGWVLDGTQPGGGSDFDNVSNKQLAWLIFLEHPESICNWWAGSLIGFVSLSSKRQKRKMLGWNTEGSRARTLSY
jgi:hypothetical protein